MLRRDKLLRADELLPADGPLRDRLRVGLCVWLRRGLVRHERLLRRDVQLRPKRPREPCPHRLTRERHLLGKAGAACQKTDAGQIVDQPGRLSDLPHDARH
jgi:hypothetical protein